MLREHTLKFTKTCFMAQSLVYVVNALCTLEKKIYFADIEWCPAVLSHSHVWLFVTPWTVARQAPLPMEILQVRILEWVAMPSSRGSFKLGIKPRSPTLQVDYSLSEPPGKPNRLYWVGQKLWDQGKTRTNFLANPIDQASSAGLNRGYYLIQIFWCLPKHHSNRK